MCRQLKKYLFVSALSLCMIISGLGVAQEPHEKSVAPVVCSPDEPIKDGPIEEVSLSLVEAMTRAQTTHPEVMGFKADVEAAQYRIRQAKGMMYPTLDFRSGVGKEYLKQKFSTNKLNAVPLSGSVNQTRADPSLTLSQRLFDGFESKYQKEKARNETFQASLKVEESRELLAFQAADHYVTLRRLQRLIDIAKKNIEAHREICGKIQALIQSGKASSSDLETVNGRLSDAETALRDIEGDYYSTRAQFIDIVGVAPTKLQSTQVAEDLIPENVEEALALAREHNKSLKLAEATKKVEKSNVKVAENTYYPRVSFEVNGAKRHRVSGNPGTEDNVTAQVVATFNLYNGGRDLARVKELKASVKKAHYAALRQRNAAERDVRVSYAEKESNKGQMIYLREAVIAKRKVVDAYLKEFVLGKISHLDILDVLNERFLAEGARITAEATYDLACIRSLTAMGLLTKKLIHQDTVANTVAGAG